MSKTCKCLTVRPEDELHVHLAADGLLAGKGFVDGSPDETGLAERAVATARGDIP